jgi:hypothetical protein
MMIVGSAMPKQILLTSGDAEPRAGEATRGPAKKYITAEMIA